MNFKTTLPVTFSALAILMMANCRDVYGRDTLLAAEPGKNDDVRICDDYGKGYFSLPETQTCMRFSGYLRASITFGDNVYSRQLGDIKRDSYSWYTRGQYRLYTATETELGTLRSYMDLRSQWQDGNDRATASLRNGWVELGGWQIGLADTNFSRWVGGYGSVANDDILNKVSRRTNFIRYTYMPGKDTQTNGFSAMLALEQGGSGADQGRDIGSGLVLAPSARSYGNFRAFRRNPNATGIYTGSGTADVLVDHVDLNTKIDDYVPHLLGGVKFKPHWGEVMAVAAYDAYHQEWAAKLRLNVVLSDQLSLFTMGGYKSHQDSYRLDQSFGSDGYLARSSIPGDGVYGVYRAHASAYGDWGGDWMFWVGGQYHFNEKQTSFNLQLALDASNSFVTSASVMHSIVPGLAMLAELDYVQWDDKIGYDIAYDSNGNPSSGVRSSLRGHHAFGGLLSLQRNF